MGDIPTSDRIKKCFQAAAIEMGFGKVTISEICKRAGICRKTFYSYFVDKYDLMTAICLDDVSLEAKKIFSILASVDASLSSTLINECIFCNIYERRDFYLSFRSREDVHALEVAFREASSSLHVSLVDIYGKGQDERLGYAIAFGAGSYAAVVLRWIETGMKTPPRELANWFHDWQIPVSREGFYG